MLFPEQSINNIIADRCSAAERKRWVRELGGDTEFLTCPQQIGLVALKAPEVIALDPVPEPEIIS